MPKKGRGPGKHTGRTARGNTRDVKIDRVGSVTIYQRGASYYLYYREHGASVRRKIDGNLLVARATAGQIVQTLAEDRPSLFAYKRAAPQELLAEYLDFAETVQQLSLGSLKRYRSALKLFGEFCKHADISCADQFDHLAVEDMIRWLRGQTRTRNGAEKGKRQPYDASGIKYVLSTCRTMFNWAQRRRMLPPYAENPFGRFHKDLLRDRAAEDEGIRIFSSEEEKAFFAACNDWQHDLFTMLATYGMRVGELSHLLIEDVDFEAGAIHIRSKPWLYWSVKSRRRRQLPLTPEIAQLLQRRIGNRQAGFVFLEERFVRGKRTLLKEFQSPAEFRCYFERIVAQQPRDSTKADDDALRKFVQKICRRFGQIVIKRFREEFCRLTAGIGCPELTRVHDLRHLFISRAQERGANPLVVSEIAGHTTLVMTRRYTHLGLAAKRAAVEQAAPTGGRERSKVEGENTNVSCVTKSSTPEVRS